MTTVGFPYALPTTANVSFQEFIGGDAQYQRPISDATAFRGRLRTALKEYKHSDRHDLLNIQKAIEDYVPLLFGLVAGIENSDLQLTTEVETTWRCTMSNVALSSKQPRVKHKSIHYEAIFSILTLGYVFMDRANESSYAVQNKIQVAIGDISTYAGGYGDGSSMAGSTHHNSSTASSGSGTGGFGGGAATSSVAGSTTGGGAGASGSSSSFGSGGGATSRLFKIGSSSSTSSSTSSKKAAKNPNTIGEFTDYLNDDDLAAIDHQLTTAADLYCKAAGIFEYVVQGMIPRWNESLKVSTPGATLGREASYESAGSGSNSGGVVTGLGVGKASLSSSSSGKKAQSKTSRPVDVQTSLISAHIKLALAEAHACTVRKATIKAARASAIKLATTGAGSLSATNSTSVSPGASAGAGTGSKTSYVLLAKLTIGVKEEYERAYGLLKSVKDLNEIATDFRAHVKDAKIYYEALAQTLLGMDAYESQHYGEAVGFMTIARASFMSLAKSSKAHTISQAAAFEYRLANEKVVAFQKINDSVTFEPVPTQAQLLGVMPSGRDLLQPKKYQVPRPSFGSAAHAGRTGSPGGADDSMNKLSYALQGAYF
ncbi:hypothetical protein BGZ99_004869 [Dissophora globulifera]|uniref:pH-response regulator protein palC n=1 Tax=Dissophora globulifera TaxID=979702 RepID=A0A9P6UU93_9FUNG|nr:hypothetical protein BGZ99_004869 [Dissophora globulifera]